MKKINQYIGKNETRYSYGGGKFFLLFYAITPVTVSFFKDSRSVGSAENVQGGLSAWIDYDEVRIESVVAQEIGFFMSGSEVRYQLEQSKSYVTVQDFLAAVILVEPEIKGLDEEISAFMLLVDVWNVPTLEAIVLAEENLSGALNETAHALAMLKNKTEPTPPIPIGSATAQEKADLTASVGLIQETIQTIGAST